MSRLLNIAARRSLIPIMAQEWMRRIFCGLMRDRVSIFMVHGISGSDAENELSVASLAAILKEVRARRLRVVSLQSSIERHLAGEPQLPDSVAFTLDDGTRQQLDIIAPLFAKYDCEATVFVITGFVDGHVWPWDYRIDYVLANTRLPEIPHSIPQLPNPLRASEFRASRDAILNYCKALPTSLVEDVVSEFAESAEVTFPEKIPNGWEAMDWEGARALERNGFRIAPHGETHSILSRMPENDAESEIRGSWERVRQEVESPCPVFAWPTGRASDFGERDIELAKRAGLLGAVTASCDYALLPPLSDPTEGLRYRIGRFSMPADRLDFLQYATWIERGKQVVLRRR